MTNCCAQDRSAMEIESINDEPGHGGICCLCCSHSITFLAEAERQGTLSHQSLLLYSPDSQDYILNKHVHVDQIAQAASFDAVSTAYRTGSVRHYVQFQLHINLDNWQWMPNILFCTHEPCRWIHCCRELEWLFCQLGITQWYVMWTSCNMWVNSDP